MNASLLRPHEPDRFTVLLYVSPYMEERYTKEQLEMAAEVLFFQTIAASSMEHPDEAVTVEWAANIFSDKKLILAHARIPTAETQEGSSAQAQDK